MSLCLYMFDISLPFTYWLSMSSLFRYILCNSSLCVRIIPAAHLRPPFSFPLLSVVHFYLVSLLMYSLLLIYMVLLLLCCLYLLSCLYFCLCIVRCVFLMYFFLLNVSNHLIYFFSFFFFL